MACFALLWRSLLLWKVTDSQLEYRRGCLIDAHFAGEVDVIAHQCNCFNTMGAGIAKTIKRRIPGAYEADRATARGSMLKLGNVSSYRGDDGWVFNLYGQYRYTPGSTTDTDYKALRLSLMEMAEQLREVGFNGTIGLPKLGAGLAGGDWKVIEKIIEMTLWGFKVVIYEL